MNVIIDGVTYTPETTQVPNIGVAVTVRNRHDTTRDCLKQLRDHTPTGVPIFIVDDASQPPFDEADKRFDTNVGIPAAKNASLELLMDAGVEHLFLFDSDCYPIVDDWWKPFVDSPEPHLSAQFADLAGDRKLGDITVLYEDDQHQAWSGQRGYCLYYHRSVIEAVGGFDLIYSPGLYEHSDLANRIFEQGFTTWRYASPKDSHLLIESLDRTSSVDRTPLPQRQTLTTRNAEIHNRRRDEHYDGYHPYREPRNVILTCLYTGRPDPQRNKHLAADHTLLNTLTVSAKPHPVVVLHDQLQVADHDNVTYVQAPNTVNVYFQRWINAYNWLRANNIDNVLICDGTDVEILKPADLFNIPPGKLLVGSEHQVVGCDWMRNNHPDPRVQAFINEHPNHTLLNAGVLAGTKPLVMNVLRDIIHTWADVEIRQFHRKSEGNGVGDMGIFSMVLHTKHADRLIYGPHVTTMFKGNERNNFSLIKHK
ncbi:glycosyltransferase [Mycobacterium phage Ritam007]|nr:hypothetical protein Saroj_88 [Mycobacterium phage Saroj]UZV39614.1 glycosyltransferase [Mycobacterium phage Ritam007]